MIMMLPFVVISAAWTAFYVQSALTSASQPLTHRFRLCSMPTVYGTVVTHATRHPPVLTH